MKKFLLIIVSMVFLSFGACTEILDIEQHGNISTKEDYYKTDDEVRQALASLYNQYRGDLFQMTCMLLMLSDDVYTSGGTRGDNAIMEHFNEYSYSTEEAWIQANYSALYTEIYKACLITDMTEPDTPYKKRAINEAKVLRAMSNFYLVSLWGNPSLVDHLLSEKEYRQSNATPAQIWAFVEKDLDEAIASGSLTSKTSVTDRENGISVTKEFAYALLGKAYLWQGKYSEAVAAFEEVISSGLYGLWGIDEPGEYNEMFHAKANNNCESIFAIQYRNDLTQSYFSTNFVFSFSLSKYFTGSCDILADGGGWGFGSPRKELYDAFIAEEGEDGYRLSSTIKTPSQLAELGLNLKTTDIYGNCGLFDWKRQLFAEDMVTNNPAFNCNAYSNAMILRYAEVLLCAAEANLLSGNQAKADQYVNMVRRRARLDPKSGVTLDDIKKEKRLELCFEYARYIDIVRWGDGERVLGEQGKSIPQYSYNAETGIGEVNYNAYTNTTYGFKEKHNLLPIPQTEIEVNPNMEQNPGW